MLQTHTARTPSVAPQDCGASWIVGRMAPPGPTHTAPKHGYAVPPDLRLSMRPLRLRPRLNLAARLLWAAPYSLLGLLVAAPACALGARLRRVDHTLECSGGVLGSWMLRLPNRHRLVALTLGHVILAVDTTSLQWLRAHERVHVRQYERWGPFFGPAYLLESLWQTWRGRDAYLANRFEREAYAKGGPFGSRGR